MKTKWIGFVLIPVAIAALAGVFVIVSKEDTKSRLERHLPVGWRVERVQPPTKHGPWEILCVRLITANGVVVEVFRRYRLDTWNVHFPLDDSTIVYEYSRDGTPTGERHHLRPHQKAIADQAVEVIIKAKVKYD